MNRKCRQVRIVRDTLGSSFRKDGEIFWCTTCVAMSTRPRITFDAEGKCNACQWADRKKTLDWAPRQHQLEALLDGARKSDGGFDCVVPVSGGKDGSYVAYQLKHKYGMNPLAVTINPPLPLELGSRNLRNFIDSGFPHVAVSPDQETMRALNRHGLMEMGFPYYGWLIAISVAPAEIALRFDCDLVFYGEDGEVEYGGSSETENTPFIDFSYIENVYLEAGYEKVLRSAGIAGNKLGFFRFPSQESLRTERLKWMNWSYFEDWDPYRNYLLAKEHCGLEESTATNLGTFTNFAQNDQALYALHVYLMYLKFGFGRANQDASIDIRRGAMSREQAVELVHLYDGSPPEEFRELYLDYFELSGEQFDAALDVVPIDVVYAVDG